VSISNHLVAGSNLGSTLVKSTGFALLPASDAHVPEIAPRPQGGRYAFHGRKVFFMEYGMMPEGLTGNQSKRVSFIQRFEEKRLCREGFARMEAR